MLLVFNFQHGRKKKDDGHAKNLNGPHAPSVDLSSGQKGGNSKNLKWGGHLYFSQRYFRSFLSLFGGDFLASSVECYLNLFALM